MALNLVSTPNETIETFDSEFASTTQLLYEFNVDDLAGKEAYVVQITIPELNDLTLFFTPEPSTGDVKINIGTAVAASIATTQTYIFYKVEYSATFRGGSVAPASTPFTLAVISRRQILTEHGANLYFFMLRVLTSGKLGNFLTSFNEPKLWRNWAHNMHLIFDPDMVARLGTEDLEIAVRGLDANKLNPSGLNLISIVTATFAVPQVNTIDIGSTLDLAGFETSEFLQIISTLGISQPEVTETLIMDIDIECQNPVMIEWINGNGGSDQWLFQTEQTAINQVGEGFKFQTPIVGTIETNRGNKGRVPDRDIQFLTLRADQLNQDQLQGLHEIKRSYAVRLWLNKTGTEYVNVIVDKDYQTSFTTGKGGYIFSLSIELPDDFDFFTAKLY